MTFAAFRQLLPQERVWLTVAQGTFLARRAGLLGDVQLYHLPTAGPGFFVELRFDPAIAAIVLVRSFQQPALLADYVEAVTLPTGC